MPLAYSARMGEKNLQVAAALADFVSEQSVRSPKKEEAEPTAVLLFNGIHRVREPLAQFPSEMFSANQAQEPQEALPVDQPTIENWGHVTQNPPEILLGRVAAASVRPVTAWQILPAPWRVLMLVGYGAVAYIVVLGVLLVL